MFDIGISEVMVIGVVALVVIGPERLPRVARTMGHLTGRMQRYVNEVKTDINREMEMADLNKFRQEVESTANAFESSVRSELSSAEADFSSAARSMVEGVTGDPHEPGGSPAAPEATGSASPAHRVHY